MRHQLAVHFTCAWLAGNGKPSSVRLSATGPDGEPLLEHVTAPPVTASAISEFVDNLCAKYGGIDRAEAERALNGLAQQINAEAELEWIDISETDTRKLAMRAWNAVAERNAKDPVLFRLSNELVRLERNCGEAPQTGQLTKEKLRYQLRRMANFFRISNGEVVLQDPPARLIEDMLAEPDAPLPMLRTLTDVPIFASDGTLINTPGYHADSGIYYRPASGLVVPPVSERPGEIEVEKAKRIIDDVLCDFPFASDADRAHAIGLMLLPFVRELIAGPTPLTLIDAPTYGTGKGLLAQVCLTPGCNELAFLPPGQDDNEWRKMITSALLENKQALVLDNVTQLRSPVLAMAITASKWQDRLLGANRVASFAVRCIWVATGNHVQLSGELMRRCVLIRLLPPCEKPWTRDPQQFRHPRLLEHVKRNRARMVWAALTLIQCWLSKGRPLYQERPLGSFEAWSQIIGGILQAAGIDGFLQNQSEFYETTDEDSLAARCFVRAWWESYQTQSVLAANLVSLARDCELLPGQSAQADEAGLARKLGRWLARNEGRVFDSYRITRAGVQQRAILWRLSPTEGTRPTYGTGDLNEGADDVVDMFAVDGLPQANASPLAENGGSVPAFTRGGTNSQNSQNSPERIYENPEPNIYENRRSELSEFREFLSPSEKGAPQITGDTTESRSDDVSPGDNTFCISDPGQAGDIYENPASDIYENQPRMYENPERRIYENPASDIYGNPVRRIYENPEPAVGQLTEAEQALLTWLRNRGGVATVREIRQSLWAMRKPGIAEAALDKLAALGLGHWEPAPAGRRGRTARRFWLTQLTDAPSGQPAAEPASGEVEPATQTEPVTATPAATPTEDAAPAAEAEPALEPVPELAPLEILDRAMRLPTEWRNRFWQLFDAAGRCPLPDRAMQAYRQLLAELPRELRPILAAAPKTEPNRPDNAVITAMLAKLSPELQRRFWQIYDRYAGKHPRKELPWLAWQELQREITQDTDPDAPQNGS
jgi:hypothetical protein